MHVGPSGLDPIKQIVSQPLLVRQHEAVRRAVVDLEPTVANHRHKALARELEWSGLVLRTMDNQRRQFFKSADSRTACRLGSCD